MRQIELDQSYTVPTIDPWRKGVGAPGAAGLVAALTPRERELLALMAVGRSNAAISVELCLSPKTVETHVRSVFWKLRLLPCGMTHRRVAAVLVYREALEQMARPAVA